MNQKFKKHTKWFFLAIGLFLFNTSFSAEYKSKITTLVNGQEATDARIGEGSELFKANCTSCHALNKKVVGPALAGVVGKYEGDYEWIVSWIKNNQKLVKSGDARANAIYSEYNGAVMNIFENLSDDKITSIIMWIENDGDGVAAGGADTPIVQAPVVSESLFNNINWGVVIMSVIVFVIILMILGILELVGNITGKEIINWNNINAYMMLIFVIGFFALSIYEYTIHNQYNLANFGSASEHGIEMDKMMNWTWLATLPIFFITQFLLFYFSFRYRQKPGRKAYFLSHNNNLEYVWTLVPAVVLAVLVSGGFKTWNKILRSDAGKDATQIEVFAYQFGWNARYPGTDNTLGKANFNLINGINPLGVANREHATELINELAADTISFKEAIARLPKEESELRSKLGGLVDKDREDHLRKIGAYSSGEKLDELNMLISARTTQIERLKRALAVEEGTMFTGTGDDDMVVQEIHLVKDQLITLKFRARDVIHSAYLPYFRTQMNVVPGLPTEFTFKPIKSTKEMQATKGDPEFDYYLVCNKICGNAHFNMKMKVIVEDQASYDKWIAEQAALFTKKTEEKETTPPQTSEVTPEAVASN